MRRFLLLLLFAVPLAAQEIEPARLAAHMRFLADDLLEGRGTGTRGHLIAARYVAEQYEALGMDVSLQNVPFRKITPIPERSSVTIGSTPLAFGSGFVTTGDPLREDASAEGQVVYVGYGITAPSQKYDDYAGVDVHGKIVAYYSGAPKSFSSDVRAHYSSSLVKYENAASHGAIGILGLRTAFDETRVPWARSVRQSKLGAMNWLESNGTPHATFPQIGAAVSLSRSGAEALLGSDLKAIETPLEAGHAKAALLPMRVSIHVAAKHERVDSPNVIGILRGSDPALRDEYVVYSAHLDHLGISEPVDGDAINNGALDNGSGIAAMLEVARAFAQTNPRPKRSLLFLATTGEEKGLKGADYFANNPTVSLSSIVADINIDEILMFHPVKDILPIGAEHSTLGDDVALVAGDMHLDVSPDPQPEEVVFVRSDQYPFVKRGVPAIYMNAGYKAIDPKIDLVAEMTKWEETIYHSPKDDMSQPMDLSVGAQVAKFNYLLGLRVANAAERPRWKKGDFFGDMFGSATAAQGRR
jgi:hypothetical protein